MDKIEQYKKKFHVLSKRGSFKYGLPFVLFMIGGSFGLQQFTRIRYEFSQKKLITEKEAEVYGIHMKKTGEVTLESEYDKIKDLDTTHWENKRGPRPWEENIPTTTK